MEEMPPLSIRGHPQENTLIISDRPQVSLPVKLHGIDEVIQGLRDRIETARRIIKTLNAGISPDIDLTQRGKSDREDAVIFQTLAIDALDETPLDPFRVQVNDIEAL